MLKRIAAIMLTIAMVFGVQSAVFAATDYVDATTTQNEVIRLAENPQLAAMNEDLQLLNATGFGGMKIEPWFWLLSIVVPGLGQFLMGDMVKGIIFFLAGTIVGVISAVAGTILASLGLGAVVGILAIILPLVFLGVYLWNIYDAYMMNQSAVGMSSIDTEKLAAQIQKVAEFAKKNQLVAYQNNGMGVHHQLATF